MTNDDIASGPLASAEKVLPSGMELVRLATLPLAHPGPGGMAVYWLTELRWTGGSLPLLLTERASLLARDIPRLRERLLSIIQDRSLRLHGTGQIEKTPLPAIATNSASRQLIEACTRAQVGILDSRGTVVVHGPGAFVHIVGRGTADRPRTAPFSGKACRLIRVLLEAPTTPHLGLHLARRTETSYAFANGALTWLEQRGFASRASRRSGYSLKDPVGLLRAWIDSGRRTAATIEAFNAPSTTVEALARADAARAAARIPGLFTLASALRSEEVHVSGLPHGMYLGGDATPVVQALGLRHLTPHNFLILRADPASETEAGGIYFSPRTLPQGQGVALPQLAVDFAGLAGRGPEQSAYLVERYASALPYSELP